MDHISFPYKCKVRPWRDSDDEIEIQWFYAQVGAKTFPNWHRFASGNWAHDREEWPGVGEVLGTRVAHWSDGPGHLEGQNFVGSLEDFQLGALRATPGLELNAMCFPGEVLGAAGGAILTGGMVSEVIAGQGAAVGAGLGESTWWGELVPDGAAIGGGFAAYPLWPPLVPDGSAEGGGFASYPLFPAVLPDGSAVGGGFATFPVWPPLVPDGNAVGEGPTSAFWWVDTIGGAGVGEGPTSAFWWTDEIDGAGVGTGD